MPDKIAEIFTKSIDYIPFVAMASGRPKLNVSKILESLIIGAIIALVMSYVALQVLEVKLDNITADIAELKSDVKQIRGDLYRPVHEKD